MKVTLAVPYDGKKPDATITVDDGIGKQLISQGRAREAAQGGTPPKETQEKQKVTEAVRAKVEESAATASVAS